MRYLVLLLNQGFDSHRRLRVVGLARKYLGAETYYYVMINAPDDEFGPERDCNVKNSA